MFCNLILPNFVSNYLIETMTEEITVEKIEIYYYFSDKGVRFYTPNLSFAHERANFFGTNKVYVESF